jgi:hypothetical protein
MPLMFELLMVSFPFRLFMRRLVVPQCPVKHSESPVARVRGDEDDDWRMIWVMKFYRPSVQSISFEIYPESWQRTGTDLCPNIIPLLKIDHFVAQRIA